MFNIDKEVAAMERMTVNQLREKYAEVFGEETRSRHKEYLIKRIAWRMQANMGGGLSERALRRAMELANLADIRVTAPRKKATAAATKPTATVATKSPAPAMLLPGMAIQREYKGRTIKVTVLANGFDYEGERYRSLTAIAKVVTGKHWNGFHFFGLRKPGGAA